MNSILKFFETIPIKDNLQIDDTICKHFRAPITYLDNKYSLSQSVIEDIELYSDCSNNVLQKMMPSMCSFENVILGQNQSYYTTDVDFLQDSQSVIQQLQLSSIDDNQPIIELWNDVKCNVNFLSKYSFMDWKILEYLNHNTMFLLLNSISNLLTPILFFIVPIIILLIPFVIIKVKGSNVSLNEYYNILKTVGGNHTIGKMILNFKEFSIKSVATSIFYIGTFIYQIYCNVQSCYRFYNNIKTVNDNMCSLQSYIDKSITNMEHFKSIAPPTYNPFIQDMNIQLDVLHTLRKEIHHLQPFSKSVKKVTEFGDLLSCYYSIFSNDSYESALSYSFGFSGYCYNLQCIQRAVLDNTLVMSQFNTDRNTVIHNQRYALIDGEQKTNSVNFSKNMIISGANASGKTTLLKSTLINIILTQQYGCGFYQACNLHPYTHIHSYLNIPDTSERDSLFQAESRRCKDIVESIQKYPDEDGFRHFCIFDELYSGTNPDEASKSGYAFLKFLDRMPHVNYMLTTHYLYICKKYKNSKTAQNYKMNAVLDKNGNIVFQYRLKKGISRLRGAIHVLKNMNYPKSILDEIAAL
jgi:hypothetical protein